MELIEVQVRIETVIYVFQMPFRLEMRVCLKLCLPALLFSGILDLYQSQKEVFVIHHP